MKTKRLIAWILTLVMLISIVPAPIATDAGFMPSDLSDNGTYIPADSTDGDNGLNSEFNPIIRQTLSEYPIAYAAEPYAEEAGLPIYFFISLPGSEPTPSGRYEDYEPSRGTQGQGRAIAAATNDSQIATTQGIRNVSPESLITQWIASYPSGYTAESFKKFGTMTLDRVTYSDEEYEITWISICKRGVSGLSCYCWGAGAHIHVDGVLSKIVEVTEDTLKMTKVIPDAAGVGGEHFNFKLYKLAHDDEFAPIDAIDTTVAPISMSAYIPEGHTSASIVESGSSNIPTLGFGYYELVEETNSHWIPQTKLYVQVSTNGRIRYSNSLRTTSFVEMQDGAIFANQRQTYSVTYKDGLNQTLFFDEQFVGINYGSPTPQFPGNLPEVSDFSKVFDGWLYDTNGNGIKDSYETVYPAGNLPATVTENTVYVAQWRDNAHSVTWLDSDGTVLEVDENVINGTVPEYNGTGGTLADLAKAKNNAQYTYQFNGWTPSVTPMAGQDQYYTATYAPTINKYTVRWLDSDDTVLEVDENVDYNTFPSYDFSSGNYIQLAAAKNTPEYTYTFLRWSPVPAEVKGDIDYKAEYTRVKNTYTVTWENFNGSTLETDTGVEYGAIPSYNGATPTRVTTAYYEYIFTGWKIKTAQGENDALYTDELGNFPSVAGNITYVAQYRTNRISFTGAVNVYVDSLPLTSPMTLENLIGSGTKMYLGNGQQGFATKYYELTQSPSVYNKFQNSEMENGNYYIYVSNNGITYTQICEQLLVIENENRERDSFFWSVTYDAAGGMMAPIAPEYYHNESSVKVSQTTPHSAGNIFMGWFDDVNHNRVWDRGEDIFAPGSDLTNSIIRPYELVAAWESAVDLSVNVVIDHSDGLGGQDTEANKANVELELVKRENPSALWVEVENTKLNLTPASRIHTYSYEPSSATDSADYTKSQYVATTATYNGTSLKLNSNWEYAITTVKHGYEPDTQAALASGYTVVADGVVRDGNTLIVYLKYTPDDFDLQFTVKVDDSVPVEAYPTAVIVRALCWDGSSWSYISQHELGKPGVSVVIDSQGNGSGSVTTRKLLGGSAADYRILVSAFVYDGKIVPATSSNGVVFTDGVYTATMSAVGTGANHTHKNLEGAYYADGQIGTLHADITIGLHDVIFDCQGGNIGGNGTVTVSDQWVTPDSANYVPERSGGYVFAGWYEDLSYTVAARKGIRLTEDKTYYAKWIEPWKVSGTITVDGTYLLNGETKSINPSDRIANVTVLLQRHSGNNNFHTVKTDSAQITYDANGLGTGTYKFLEVPNEGEWRVLILSHNYRELYNNEPIADGAFYEATETVGGPSTAIDADLNGEAVVDVKMSFTPETFPLWFKVIATDIGEGYRPNNAEIVILYDNDYESSSYPTTWPVISQMISAQGGYDGTLVYLKVSGNEYSGLGSYLVWQNHPVGYVYDYAIGVEAVDGIDRSDSDGFTVEYKGTAEYQNPGAYENQTTLLTATLKPKTFPIKYYFEQGSSVEIKTLSKNTHTWSFETDVRDQIPTRREYVFKGWVDANGNPIEKISADVKREVKLYAVWDVDKWRDGDATQDPNDIDSPIGGDGIPDSKQVHIVYNATANGITNPTGEIYTVDGTSYTDVSFTASGSTPAAAKGYAFDKWVFAGSSQTGDNATASITPDSTGKIAPTLTNADGGNTYTFEVSFAVDEKGGEHGGDGIADKYQAFVEFVSGNSAHGTVKPAPNYKEYGTIRQVFNFGTETSGTVTPDITNIVVDAADSFALDYWTKDSETDKLYSVPTSIENVQGGTTIVFYAHFSKDEWSSDTNSDNEGDGTPDNRQVLVEYMPTANGRGVVKGDAVQVFDLTRNAQGEYKGSIDPSDNVTPEGNSGWTFDYWGDADGFWGEIGAKVDNLKPFAVHENVVGGQIIIYVAHFAKDDWKDDDAGDSTEGGDDIPDSKQILVEYFSEDTSKGSVSNAVEVITLTDGTTTYNAQGSTATAASGYAFDRWRYTQDFEVSYKPMELTVSPVIMNPAGGNRYSFYATFDIDEKGGENGGDGIPDKYQAFVEFVSATPNRGAVAGAVVQAFTFRDADGNYASSGTVIPSLARVYVTAQPRNEFKYWTIDDRQTELNDIEVQAPIEGVAAGTTITVKAYFGAIFGGSTEGGGNGGSKDYILNYESDGGTEYPDESYSHGTVVDIVKQPEKEGYIFDGWYLDEELTKPVDEVKMTKDTWVYAKWVKDNGSAGIGYPTPERLNGKDHFAYVIGYTDGTVKPNANITRAEVTTIFFRLLKEDVRERNLTNENVFTDVNANDWYNTAVSTMAKLGIVVGRTADTFAPNANITRAEFAAICARFDDSLFVSVDNFTDISGHWAESYIREAASHGWIRGYSNGTFKPDQLITRAEAMTMINRILNRVPETAEDLLPDMITFTDNLNEYAWYYLPIQEATNSHDYEMKNNIYERWIALNDGIDWTQYQ